MDGQRYIESLRDGREVWLHGEKVADVTEHPAFRNVVRPSPISTTCSTRRRRKTS